MSQEPLILITGAAGMIGSGVVRYLNDKAHENLVLVDDLKTGDKWKNLVGKSFVDLISKHQLFDYLPGKNIDAIIHLGACSDTMENNCDYLLENNFRYTIRLAKWAVQHGVRFIYASSAATYGDGSLGFDDDETRLKILRPLNMYGYSKHLVDLWLQREGLLNKVVGLKYFNVFGPNEYHKGRMASMLLKMTQKVQADGKIELFKSNDPKYGHGDQVRDFIYLKDAVKITCSLLDPLYRNICGIFNVGRGEPTTWNFLASSLFRAMKKQEQIFYVDMPQTLSTQYQNYTCATMNKLQQHFCIKSTPIEVAVEEYVTQYLLPSERW